MADLQPSRFYTVYDVTERRRHPSPRPLAAHQSDALVKIGEWYKSKPAAPRGGILVLPTGGGKTFTALHFICRNPLSEGYKVLWLAHTHHLLEQASSYFTDVAGRIEAPRDRLTVRVVSGTPEHFPIHKIEPADDVVICSLQTAANGAKNDHPRLDDFLKAAGGKLFVVFDEAHHAPAPSYRTLLGHLRNRCPELYLLGLTATPIYNDERKQGWLLKLFPQNILYQISPKNLMAAKILSQPVLEDAPTEYKPAFDEHAFQKWTATFRDIPEDVINQLATKQERNDAIVGRYVSNKVKYGKTIIFADRWHQCVYLREALNSRGVRAGAVYSHIDADPGSADARNRRKESENAQVLADFKAGRLDVLINVRMLTEGTDVPDVQTVFLTRQTTSRILLTQMVGRGLRGQMFGGTEKAYIVSFIDSWTHRIDWAAYDPLNLGPADDSAPDYGKRPPIQLVSIELVRRLSAQLDSGNNTNPAPYNTFLPAGWYLAEYSAARSDEEQVEPVRRLVMVFDHEKEQYERLIAALLADKLASFQDDAVHLDEARQEALVAWKAEFFPDETRHVGSDLEGDLFGLARHVAQNREAPRFFEFKQRDEHDLDAVAKNSLARRLDRSAERALLTTEFSRGDRYWQVLYNTFSNFKSHFDACVNRIQADEDGDGRGDSGGGITNPPSLEDREPSDEIKAQVKDRDHSRCLCCGSTRKLRIDHISARYFGGGHNLDNLQTLCEVCNLAKGIDEISFRTNQTRLTSPQEALPTLRMPEGSGARDPAEWEMFLRRSLNFFFRCAAVNHVVIGQKGEKFRRWSVWLFSGNDARWLESHKADLVRTIREARDRAGYEAAPDEILVY